MYKEENVARWTVSGETGFDLITTQRTQATKCKRNDFAQNSML
jgi:hypothetical protein